MDAWFKVTVSSPPMQGWSCRLANIRGTRLPILCAHVDLRDEDNGSKGGLSSLGEGWETIPSRSTSRSLNQTRATTWKKVLQLRHCRWIASTQPHSSHNLQINGDLYRLSFREWDEIFHQFLPSSLFMPTIFSSSFFSSSLLSSSLFSSTHAHASLFVGPLSS